MSTTSAPLDTVYCSDEHVCIRDPDDFAVLTPRHQCIARGTAGYFTADEPWVLKDDSADFEASGVISGYVIVLKARGNKVYQASGEAFAVEAIEGSNLTLRRVGLEAGAGMPPGTVDGVSGVEYSIETLGPQIEQESFALNREYAIDPADPSRSPDGLYDLRDLRDVCVLQVLAARYAFAMRTAADGSDFKAKLNLAMAELSDRKARLSVRWALTVANDSPPPSTRFSTRLVR